MTRSLHFAAAPAFTFMALVTGVLDQGVSNPLCSSAAGAWLGGMTPMYLLMAMFHSAPWLKLWFKLWLKLVSRRNAVTLFQGLDRSSDIQAMEQKP